jgi:regulator of sigma E protease
LKEGENASEASLLTHDLQVSLILAIAGLAFLIIVHELAHYGAAKVLGLNPFKFMLFFPPILFSRVIGKTEWGIGMLPLGGFVSIAGMHRPQGDSVIALRESLGLDSDLFLKLKETVDNGVEIPLAIREKIEEEVAGNLKAEKELLALSRDMAPNAYWRVAPWRRALVVAAGPIASALLAFILAFIFYFAYSPSSVRLSEVLPSYPAARAGIKAGDTVKDINGQKVRPGTLLTSLQRTHGGVMRVTLLRKGHSLNVSVKPVYKQGSWKLGIIANDNPYHGQLVGAARESANVLWQTTTQIAGKLSSIIKKPVGKNGAVSGPVGIVDTSNGILGHSLAYWPLIFGLISLALALTNALPIPPLDGGHFLIAIIEWIRRKPLSRRAEQLVIAWGVVFVVLVFGVGLLNDLLRL